MTGTIDRVQVRCSGGGAGGRKKRRQSCRRPTRRGVSASPYFVLKFCYCEHLDIRLPSVSGEFTTPGYSVLYDYGSTSSLRLPR